MMGLFGPTKQEKQVVTLTSEVRGRNVIIDEIGRSLQPVNTEAICLQDGQSVLDAVKRTVAAFLFEIQETAKQRAILAEIRSNVAHLEDVIRELRETTREVSETMVHWIPSDESIEDLPEPICNYILEMKDIIKKQFDERVEEHAEDDVDEIVLCEENPEPNPDLKPACSCPSDYTCSKCIGTKLGW